MIKIIRYHPRENDDEPRIYSIPKRTTRYRLELYGKLPGNPVAEQRIIRIVDPMTIQAVHELAIEHLNEMVSDCQLAEDAWFEVWAE